MRPTAVAKDRGRLRAAARHAHARGEGGSRRVPCAVPRPAAPRGNAGARIVVTSADTLARAPRRVCRDAKPNQGHPIRGSASRIRRGPATAPGSRRRGSDRRLATARSLDRVVVQDRGEPELACGGMGRAGPCGRRRPEQRRTASWRMRRDGIARIVRARGATINGGDRTRRSSKTAAGGVHGRVSNRPPIGS